MNFKLGHKTINSETVDVPSNDVCVLGPNLVLNECVLQNRAAAKNLSLCGMIMNGGVFVTKKKLSDFQFRRVEFNNVIFEGIYSGCDFGWDSPVGKINFSTSILNSCRFIGDIDKNIVFPLTDHIVITKTHVERLKIGIDTFSPRIQMLINVLTKNQPADLQLTVLHIPTLAKQIKVTDSEIMVLKEA